MVKIVDLEKADIMRSESLRKINYPHKDLFLEVGDRVFELEISDISMNAIYLSVGDEVETVEPKFYNWAPVQKDRMVEVSEGLLEDIRNTLDSVGDTGLVEELDEVLE